VPLDDKDARAQTVEKACLMRPCFGVEGEGALDFGACRHRHALLGHALKVGLLRLHLRRCHVACVTAVTAVTAVLVCVTAVLVCVTAVLVCVTAVLVCVTAVLVCVTAVLVCVTAVLVCVTAALRHCRPLRQGA